MWKRGLLAAVFVVTVVLLGIQLFPTSSSQNTAESTQLPSTETHTPQPPASYQDLLQSGGPPKDGIPSIDNPEFISAEETALVPGDPVIGVLRNGTPRAYPQNILVHHEIVNDAINNENIAVTYCPLTGSPLGFQRGNTTLGVSGKLINSNLVMYDRSTEAYIPQLLGVGITEPLTGKSIPQIRTYWATWEDWRTTYPDTLVLSQETGFLRNYDADPYGSYNPIAGYYASDNLIFPVENRDGALPPKELVLGYVDTYGAVGFNKETLSQEKQRTVPHGNNTLTMLWDERLQTGRLYPGNLNVTIQNQTPHQNGEPTTFADIQTSELPAFDVFYFAWHAFYPEAPLHG